MSTFSLNDAQKDQICINSRYPGSYITKINLTRLNLTGERYPGAKFLAHLTENTSQRLAEGTTVVEDGNPPGT